MHHHVPRSAAPAVTLPPPGTTVYLMGICGTGMAALAGLLRQKGYAVRGSDSRAYPPMSDLLERLKIPVSIGYDPRNLEEAPDLVIIGNVIRADNPEAVHVLRRGIPYLSFPEAVSRLCLADRTPLVVSGTHGKTTTSALLVSALEKAATKPGFMIGGVLKSTSTGFSLGEPPWFVLEGDEYDTAFFDKNPKFLHYRPFGAVLTSLEFDHADIFADLAAVKQAFSRFVRLVPSDGVLVACGDWPSVRDVCARALCKVVTYGENPECDWQTREICTYHGGARFQVVRGGRAWGQVHIPLPGRHNALNALAVIALCSQLGLQKDMVLQGLGACQGVRRRQEIRGEAAGVTVVDDFAHHPTAVRETISALKEQYGTRRLIVVFEPRTNTSRRRVFQNIYPLSFDAADRVLVREVADPGKAPEGDLFSSRRLVDDLIGRGLDATYFPDAGAILNDLENSCRSGDVVAILSNGDFENLHVRLLAALGERA